MGDATPIDLARVSFSEFVAFLFDHEVPAESEKRDPWYWHAELQDFDAQKICGHYVRLFRGPKFLLTSFTTAQLEQGFWAIQVPNLDCSAYWITHESGLPLSAREKCIRSMGDLFELLFAKESLDAAVHMWWDSLCYDWHCGNRDRTRGGEDGRLQDIFF
jgi:hypothetical protein